MSLGFRLLVVGLAALGPLSLNVLKPCLPFLQAELGAGAEVIQLSLSLAIAVAAVATVLAGALTDRFGQRPVVLVSLALYGAGSALTAAAPTAAVMVVGRVVQAAASSVGLVTARTLVHDAHDVGASAPAVARVTMVVVAAVLLSPALGGLLIEWWSFRAVFVFLALLGVPLFALAYAALPAAPRARASSSLGEAWPLLRSRVFLGYLLQSSFQFAVFFAFTSAASYLLVNELSRPATEYGLWFLGLALSAFAGLGLASRLSDVIRGGRLALLGSAVVCAGSLGVSRALLSGELTALGLFAPAGLAALGIGLSLPPSHSGAMDLSPAHAGTASGVMSAAQMLIAAVFAQLVVAPGASMRAATALVVGAGGLLAALTALLSRGHGVTSVAQRALVSPEVARG